MKSDSIKELTAALAKAQIAFKPIKRTEKVGYDTTKGRKQYNYAPLIEVIEATKHALSDNGLAVTQSPHISDGNTILETLLSHSSGEWISSELYVGKYDQPPQSEGSALTYKRRYGLSAILNVSSEDDDDGITAQETKPQEIKPETKSVIKAEAKTEAKPSGITATQTKKIYATVKEKELTPEQIKTYMKSIFNKLSTKELTVSEASRLIEDLEADKIKKVQPANRLVEEAKKLGATEIPEGEE